MKDALTNFASILSGALAAVFALLLVGAVVVLSLPWVMRFADWYLNWVMAL